MSFDIIVATDQKNAESIYVWRSARNFEMTIGIEFMLMILVCTLLLSVKGL